MDLCYKFGARNYVEKKRVLQMNYDLARAIKKAFIYIWFQSPNSELNDKSSNRYYK